jgi:hypothetical protein
MSQRSSIIALLLLAACADGRSAPSKLGSLVACSEDCNGQLYSRDCATLDPDAYAGGIAYCADDCTVDVRDCVLRDPGACNPLDSDSCPAGQTCVQVGSSVNNGVCVTSTPNCQAGTTRCQGNTVQQLVAEHGRLRGSGPDLRRGERRLRLRRRLDLHDRPDALHGLGVRDVRRRWLVDDRGLRPVGRDLHRVGLPADGRRLRLQWARRGDGDAGDLR